MLKIKAEGDDSEDIASTMTFGLIIYLMSSENITQWL